MMRWEAFGLLFVGLWLALEAFADDGKDGPLPLFGAILVVRVAVRWLRDEANP